jgi:hypothetical protein
VISASFTTVAAYGSRSRDVIAASWVPPLLLALAIVFLTTLSLPSALVVAPTPLAYLPHSRAADHSSLLIVVEQGREQFCRGMEHL